MKLVEKKRIGQSVTGIWLQDDGSFDIRVYSRDDALDSMRRIVRVETDNLPLAQSIAETVSKSIWS